MFNFFKAYFFTRAGAGAGQKKTGAGQKWTGSATLTHTHKPDNRTGLVPYRTYRVPRHITELNCVA